MTDRHAAGYDFVQLGETLAANLTRAAEEQVTKAQAILDQTKSMAEIIRNQVQAQAKQIEDMNVRFKAFGEQMLDAHRQLDGNEPARAPASSSSLARRGSFAGAGADRIKPAGIGTLDPSLTVDPRRKDHSVGQRELPSALADLDLKDKLRAAARTNRGEDHPDPARDDDGRAF